MSRRIYSVLSDSQYPTVGDLAFSIVRAISYELDIAIDNARSGIYSLDEIADQLEKLNNLIDDSNPYREVTVEESEEEENNG